MWELLKNMQHSSDGNNRILSFINSYKIYFIIIFCLFSIGSFFYFQSIRPASESGMMKKAEDFAQSGQIAFAIENYNKIVRLFPKNYEAHCKLANLYLEVNENDSAKIECMKAIELNDKHKFAANIIMSDIYIKEHNYNFAESFINDIKDTKDRHAKQLIGDFYYKWGTSLIKNDNTEALRKFIIASDYYKESDSPKLTNLNQEIRGIYFDIANSLSNDGNLQEAVNIIKTSLTFWDNAEAHCKLAKLYKEQNKIDNALSEYKTAFSMNPAVESKYDYVQLLIKKAEISRQKGDKVSEKLYYTLANKNNAKVKVPSNPFNNVILTISSTKSNEDMDNDILTPEVSLRLTNISKNIISNLKIKVIFFDNNKIYAQKIKEVISETRPLNIDSSTDKINIISPESVNYVLDKHELRAQIYISQKTPDEWVLFRNVKILTKKKSAVSFIEDK